MTHIYNLKYISLIYIYSILFYIFYVVCFSFSILSNAVLTCRRSTNMGILSTWFRQLKMRFGYDWFNVNLLHILHYCTNKSGVNAIHILNFFILSTRYFFLLFFLVPVNWPDLLVYNISGIVSASRLLKRNLIES